MDNSKKRIFPLILALVFLINLFYLPQMAFASAVDDLKITSPAVILIEASTGEVLLEKNAHEPRPIASVTKIMTMTLIMEAMEAGKFTLEDMVETSEHASQMGGSQIWLEVGEQMSVSDMMKAIAIESSNDAAVAMAEYIAGSESAFVDMMNDKASSFGLMNTKFSNATGLPTQDGREDNYSSAYDVAVMSQELLKHHAISQWLTIWLDSVRDGENILTNTNKLLKSYSGADGIKTGYTDKAKYCLSASAVRSGVRVIAVVLGADTSAIRFAEASRLMDYGFKYFTSESIVKKGQKICEIKINRAEERIIELAALDDLNVVIKKGENEPYETRIALPDSVSAPIKAGQKIGELVAFRGDKEIGKVDIVASADVERLSFFPHLFRSISDMFRRYFLF